MIPAEEIDDANARLETGADIEVVESADVGDVTAAETENGGEMPAAIEAEDPQTAAERALAEYAEELRRMSQGRQAAADHHHRLGRRLMEEGRLPQAIEHLKIAVDYFPNNEEYRRALRDAETLAGRARDSRSTYIDQLADSMRVEHQRLWVEIEQHLDRGRRLLEEGSYNQAEQAFDMASTRLQHLPFQDERRGPRIREVESLIQLTRERRSRQEVADAATSNRVSAERARQLREYELGLERERINMLLRRALKARERRDFDECITICEQILKIRPNEARASTLLVTARRERHVYLRQVTADRWDEEHRRFSQDIRSSMLPQLDLIVYPDDWDEIDRRRRPPTRGVDGTEDEAWRQEIIRNLNQQLTLEFRDNDIQDVVNFLRANTDVNFVLDPEVLVGGGVPPINMQVSDIRLENALDFIMELTGLRYSLQNEAVYISTEAGLQGRTEMRIYDIRDLTMGLTQFPGPEIEIPEPGGQGSRLVPEITDDSPPDVGELMDIIQLVVSPDSWMEEGVGIDEYQGSMVISQTPEVHRRIEDLLTQLRRQRGVQINVKVRFLEIENSMLEEIGFNWSEYGGPIPVTGANPAVPQSGPPYAFGMYGRAGDGSQRAGAGTVNTPLIDYFSQARGYSRPTPASRSNPGDGDGLSMDLQIFRGEKGFLGSVLMQAVEKSRRGNVLIQPDVTLLAASGRILCA
ncbi:MAG: hypothetical protein EA402_06310 [Planctomycetota bacterium]|nr:MAG: hypothetical protein EA402_06310 [Planctomycetota bacterium]